MADSKLANNLLLIPEYEGIVVKKDDYYGLINLSGQTLIPIVVTNMYSITNSNKNTYYLTYQENTMNVIEYLRDTLKIEPVDKSVANNTTEDTFEDENNTTQTDTKMNVEGNNQEESNSTNTNEISGNDN